MNYTMTETDSKSNLKITDKDLRSAFIRITDPRKGSNLQYDLVSMLLAAIGALLSNHLGVLAIAEWLDGQNEAVKAILGFNIR
ncbi:transposase family protein [Candidatus Chlorohelix sp.]|uniref:transposase family protein n=1 Tax=Candidatus Chlorohelix sp. TaxID=3139201 RepID=UPI003074DC1B